MQQQLQDSFVASLAQPRPSAFSGHLFQAVGGRAAQAGGVAPRGAPLTSWGDSRLLINPSDGGGVSGGNC